MWWVDIAQFMHMQICIYSVHPESANLVTVLLNLCLPGVGIASVEGSSCPLTIRSVCGIEQLSHYLFTLIYVSAKLAHLDSLTINDGYRAKHTGNGAG